MGDLPGYWPSTEDRHFPLPRTVFDTTMHTRVHEAAAARPSSDLAAVGRTAALLHGVEALPPGFRLTAWPVEFSLTGRSHVSLAGSEPSPGFRLHRWNIPEDQLTTVGGIRATGLERTIVDCARNLPRLEAQAAVDQMLSKGASLERVGSIVDAQTWPTSQLKQLRAVIGDADARSQSPMESWCRRMMLDAEFPRLCPQQPVLLQDGAVVHLDLGFEEFGVGAEYDGIEFHSAAGDVAHDRRRRGLIARAGWRLVVFRAEHVIRDPAQMLWTMVRELRACGWSPSAARLERIGKRINFIAMRRRLEREAKFGVRSRRCP